MMPPVFGSLGFTEIAFILILALLLFGPKRLPEIGRTVGKGLSEFRRASNDLKRTLETEVAEEERAARRPAAPLAPAAPLVRAAELPAGGEMPADAAAPGGVAEGSPTAAAPAAVPAAVEPPR